MHKFFRILALSVLVLIVSPSLLSADEEHPKTNKWLLDAENDTARFELIEAYLRGFDQPMWEVGHRYGVTFDAISNKNYQLASYQWTKIKLTIQNGYLKRPARKQNANLLFLENDAWKALDKALLIGDDKLIQASFLEARQGCIGCHIAEKVAFMNDQELFKHTTNFAKSTH